MALHGKTQILFVKTNTKTRHLPKKSRNLGYPRGLPLRTTNACLNSACAIAKQKVDNL
jgi:hypothetical protein